MAACSHASTTAARMRSCKFLIGMRSVRASAIASLCFRTVLIVHFRLGAQFGCSLLRRSVTQKIAAANFRPGQILQQIRFAERRVELDMEMERAVVATISRSLVQRHDVRK